MNVSVLTPESKVSLRLFTHLLIPPPIYASIECLLSTHYVQNSLLDAKPFFLKPTSDHVTALLRYIQWLPIAKCKLQITRTMNLPTYMLLFMQSPLSGLSLLVIQMLLKCLFLAEVVSRPASVPIPTPHLHNALSSMLTKQFLPPSLLYLTLHFSSLFVWLSLLDF